MDIRREDIVRKILALKRVASSTQFQGQAEAALAAIDRLAEKYRVDAANLKDDTKMTRTVANLKGWKKGLAVHLAHYFGLQPAKARGHRGVLFLLATEAEFELWTKTVEFYCEQVGRRAAQDAGDLKLVRMKANECVKALRKEIKDVRKQTRDVATAQWKRFNWYVNGFIGETCPIDGRKGRKCRITLGEAAAYSEGAEAGRKTRVEIGPRAIEQRVDRDEART